MTIFRSGSLTYTGVSFQFGEGTPFAITDFKRGAAGFRTDDRDRVRRDGRQMGRDFKQGPQHTLSLVVLGEGVTLAEREASVRELTGQLAAVWSADSLRSRNGAVAELRIGERVVRGRPREFTPDDSGLWDGTDEPVLVFDAVDDLWYGPSESTRVRFSVPETGGLRFPATAPFTFDSGPTQDNGTVTVPGERPTWPIFKIHGPVMNPTVQVTGVGKLQFDVTLAYDQTLTVNTGEGWVKRGNAALPGALSARGARLSDMQLAPGSYAVILGGYDPTGSGYLDVQVEPAFTTL